MPDVPATGAYATAAYVIAAVILGSYAFILWRRGRKG
ncbi:MAG TPA: LPXTG cell wall anchor domain-containing protein [Gemmatimonadales bacterium]